MNTKGIMNKIGYSFFGLMLIYGISLNQVQGQNNAAAAAFIRINKNANVAQIDYVNSFSNNSTATYNVLGNTIIISTDNSKLLNNTVQNLGAFTISSENKNTFSVSLPAHPIMLKNSVNGNTLQVTGSQTSIQSDQNKTGKSTRVVKLDGSINVGAVNKDQTGVYSGTYPITFVYN